MDAIMSSSRPYLIRAIYQWINDNSLTPYILVNADFPETTVPTQFVEDGKIILNISAQAADELNIDNDWLLFSARFSGQPMAISIPVQAILAIYAKENGQGMVLDRDSDDGDQPPPGPPHDSGKSRSAKKPHLQLVK